MCITGCQHNKTPSVFSTARVVNAFLLSLRALSIVMRSVSSQWTTCRVICHRRRVTTAPPSVSRGPGPRSARPHLLASPRRPPEWTGYRPPARRNTGSRHDITSPRASGVDTCFLYRRREFETSSFRLRISTVYLAWSDNSMTHV